MISSNRIMLLACGSFSPPTPMHLRMFEIARDYFSDMGSHTVIGGVISPVHDAYGKKGLVNCKHRLAMVKLGLQSSNWIRLSDWECLQDGWTKTRVSLQYHQNYVNSYLNDINGTINEVIPAWIPDDIKQQEGNVQFKLLCGADLLESFSVPGLWADEDIESILGQHGIVVITRSGSNPEKFIFESDLLNKHRRNITIITNWVANEVSSTVARRFLGRGLSVKYLLDDIIIEYIKKFNLYGVNDAKYILTPNNNNSNNQMLLTTSNKIREQKQQKQQQHLLQQHQQLQRNETQSVYERQYTNDNYRNNLNLTNTYYNDMDQTDYSSYKKSFGVLVSDVDEKKSKTDVVPVTRSKVFCCDPLNVKSLMNRPGQAVKITSSNNNNNKSIPRTITTMPPTSTSTSTITSDGDLGNGSIDTISITTHPTLKHCRSEFDDVNNSEDMDENENNKNNHNNADDSEDDDDDDKICEVGENKLSTITLNDGSSSNITTTTTTSVSSIITSVNTPNFNHMHMINNKLQRKVEYLSDNHLDKLNILESHFIKNTLMSDREMLPSATTTTDDDDENDLIKFVFTSHGIRVISDKEYVV